METNMKITFKFMLLLVLTLSVLVFGCSKSSNMISNEKDEAIRYVNAVHNKDMESAYNMFGISERAKNKCIKMINDTNTPKFEQEAILKACIDESKYNFNKNVYPKIDNGVRFLRFDGNIEYLETTKEPMQMEKDGYKTVHYFRIKYNEPQNVFNNDYKCKSVTFYVVNFSDINYLEPHSRKCED